MGRKFFTVNFGNCLLVYFILVYKLNLLFIILISTIILNIEWHISNININENLFTNRMIYQVYLSYSGKYRMLYTCTYIWKRFNIPCKTIRKRALIKRSIALNTATHTKKINNNDVQYGNYIYAFRVSYI